MGSAILCSAAEKGQVVVNIAVGNGAMMVVGVVTDGLAMNVSSVCGGWQREEEDEVWEDVLTDAF
ncbi:hypothetical protein DEO72_LG5g2103 [Vigna unguiculata]|uniref:Uncharacterized protein n=1 Tax=Vigna unguiculata TaxID=3917 RepID=A0A4D6LZ28_VIGUN|nr:hypothetical protein DEO72_LG5g2103 [Vigna unguiculata]